MTDAREAASTPFLPALPGSRVFAFDANDDEVTRRQKRAIFLTATTLCACGVVWTLLYALVFGAQVPTALPALFVVVVASALGVSHLTRNHRHAIYAQIACIMHITAAIQWTIGGLFESGFVLVWSFLGPVTALAFFSVRRAALCFAIYIANIVVTIVFDDFFAAHGVGASEGVRKLFFGMNLGVLSLVIFLLATYYVISANRQRARANALQHDLDEVNEKRLGPYTLEEKLGQGGMGVVFRARHALLRRPTAIKLLSTEDADAQDLERFEREVQLTSELTHPNIVGIYDYGHSPAGEFYYAMEFLPGVDLETLVKRWGPLPPARAVGVLAQVADALEDAHHRGLIHRDIKPANIVLSRVGTRMDVAKVVDFGLVKDVERPSELTGENDIAGTPAYLAPETLTAPDQVGPATDLYALGAVAFFLLTGERVFSGRTLAQICAHHIFTAPQPPSSASEVALPESLDAVVLKCLEKDPALRYSTAGALGRALRDLDGLGTWTREDAEAFWDDVEGAPMPLTTLEAAPTHHAVGAALTIDQRRRS